MPIKQHNKGGVVDQPCDAFADRLVDLSDGELPAVEAAIVREHCEACSACRMTLVRLDRSRAVLSGALVANRPVDATVSVEASSVETSAEGPTLRPASRASMAGRGWRVVLAACTAAAALALVAFWLIQWPDGAVPGGGASPPLAHAGPDENEQAAAVYETPELIARRLALIEQVARLEASLAMTPDDPWFTAQRTANERLLAGFRQAVEELSPSAGHFENTPSRTNEAL